jgi:hypothetical protein
MVLKTGMRLKSAVCSLEAIIIRAPKVEGVLSCGAAPLLPFTESGGDVAPLEQDEPDRALAGKRYIDEAVDMEVLCTKSGRGALSFDGRVLTPKEAKPLPASD